MTEELKQKAFNFLEKHTYYDECKGTHYRDLTEMELLVLFAEEVTKELQEELKNRKDEWQEQVQKANDESYARTLQTIQLTKAKEIISEWEDSFCRGADYLYLGNKSKELRIKSQKFLNSEVNNALS